MLSNLYINIKINSLAALVAARTHTYRSLSVIAACVEIKRLKAPILNKNFFSN